MRAAPTSATNIAGRGVAMLAWLATIPAVMQHLTQEQFGLWVRLSSLIAMLDFSGLCIGNRPLSGLAEAYCYGDRRRVRALGSRAMIVLSAVPARIVVGAANDIATVNRAVAFGLY